METFVGSILTDWLFDRRCICDNHMADVRELQRLAREAYLMGNVSLKHPRNLLHEGGDQDER